MLPSVATRGLVQPWTCAEKLGGPSLVSRSIRSHTEMLLLSWSKVSSLPPVVPIDVGSVGGVVVSMLSVHAATPSDAPNKIVRVCPKRVIGILLRT